MTRPRNDGPALAGPVDARPVLYAIVCGSPVARYVGRLVSLAQHEGWQVCVVATPDGRKFLDVATLAAQTGHPVRSTYKSPGEPDVLPGADAMVVAPATVNTVNKWAHGIADTLALGLLIEGYGLGVPIVAMPYTNEAMAAHPTFRESLGRLREWGVRVLFGDEVVAMPRPGTSERYGETFPWHLALAELGPVRAVAAAHPVSPAGHPGRLGRNRRSLADKAGPTGPVSPARHRP